MQLRETSSVSRLDGDPYRGIQEATRNGQTRLAMDYAVLVIHDLARKITELEVKVTNLEKRLGSLGSAPVAVPEQEKKATRRVVRKDVDDTNENTD